VDKWVTTGTVLPVVQRGPPEASRTTTGSWAHDHRKSHVRPPEACFRPPSIKTMSFTKIYHQVLRQTAEELIHKPQTTSRTESTSAPPAPASKRAASAAGAPYDAPANYETKTPTHTN
jgi:hypothetical protein